MGKKEGRYYTNPITGRKIPEGYTEHPITGELIKQRQEPLFGGGSWGNVRSERGIRQEKPMTAREKHAMGLAIILTSIVLVLFFIWQWATVHVFEAALLLLVIIGVPALILWKVPASRQFLGAMLSKIWGTFSKPPPETIEGVGAAEEKRLTPQLSNADRFALQDRVGNKCEYCGQRYALEVHHIIPREEGGSNKQSNLIVLCGTCHTVAQNGTISRSRLLDIARKRR